MSGIKVVTDKTEEVLRAIQNMLGKQVFVGVPGDNSKRKKEAGEAMTNVQIAYLHDKGSPANNIPARPFLIPGMKAAQEKCANILKQSAIKAISGAEALSKGFNAAGMVAQSAVRLALTKGEGFAPLAKSTLAARKSKGYQGESPLIRTGQLRRSITYVVRNK